MINTKAKVEAIGSAMLEELAAAFPIACASDEFFYFPQAQLAEPRWSQWDRFHPETIAEIGTKLAAWENELEQLKSLPLNLDTQIDIALLQKIAGTLREQLLEVRAWEFQPTFYLTIAGIGLAEALESEDPAAKHERARGLSGFLDQVRHNLKQVPLLFQELGLEMVADMQHYLGFLGQFLPEIHPARAALERFRDTLQRTSIRDQFHLPYDLLAPIIRFHLNCESDIREANSIIDQEIDEMQEILHHEAREILSGSYIDDSSQSLWIKAIERIPLPSIGKEGLVGLYQNEVDKLARHCVEQGWLSSEMVDSCPVQVAPMPSFLSAIRTASSYSIQPKHPPSGGKFYILDAQGFEKVNQKNHREYRMLSAHETYPGHHLLDVSRWGLARSCRRAVEQPIFYEGWACFAEELMRITGYFSNPGERLLLAKRRLWRAIRGKVDLGLQTGTMTKELAAQYLNDAGIGVEQAKAAVRKYPLNPGYQLCYTIGMRRFLSLFDRYGRDNVRNFVRTILTQGEINFIDLEKNFQN